ncbi:MAG TPA: hypothetical protein DDY21_04550 [Candidatus Moranbacteria bacterium]|nr:hypothetical protein [Candidatus Moranbacteria bacterium]HCO99196.1 hypothetical protein [Candidatus Moranbacteria bacterium]
MSVIVAFLAGIILKDVPGGVDVFLCLTLLAVYISGILFGMGATSYGEAESFKEIKDDIYTYRGNISGVYIIEHIDKSGEEIIFAVKDLPIIKNGVEKLNIGNSFRKVREEIVVIL